MNIIIVPVNFKKHKTNTNTKINTVSLQSCKDRKNKTYKTETFIVFLCYWLLFNTIFSLKLITFVTGLSYIFNKKDLDQTFPHQCAVLQVLPRGREILQSGVKNLLRYIYNPVKHARRSN